MSFQTLQTALDIETARLVRTQATMMAFARCHDWGKDAKANDDGSITVSCECHLASGDWVREYSTVRTMEALRTWAGY